ncbi:MAG: trypsin-like serine peptidase, partial [Planctomycetota bacterium]
GGQCGICGADDRVPSNELWSARLLPAGCTASVYNTSSCLVSAGHCISGGMVIQFDVPASNPNCSINHPPVEDQFPITSSDSVNGGVGNDWSVLVSGVNNLGQLPFARYGEMRPIASTPGSFGQTVTLWGYGVDNTCVNSQRQQTSSGTITFVGSTWYEFNVDLRGGNSGSGLMRNDEIIGVVTHCSFGCPNFATRVDLSSFANAIDDCGVADCPGTGDCCQANGTPGCDDQACCELVCACDPSAAVAAPRSSATAAAATRRRPRWRPSASSAATSSQAASRASRTPTTTTSRWTRSRSATSTCRSCRSTPRARWARSPSST